MELLYERCAGLDVHKKTVTVCLKIAEGTGQRSTELRTYATTTQELLAMGDWLKEQGCTQGNRI